MAKEPKNIVLLSDGTGNSAAKVWRTNVWRLFQSLDLTNSRQVALYEDGVGSSSFKPLALLGGIFGWGLKRNVLELYAFLCRNWEPGARIYAFGFSRGAFTIRVALGLVANQGVVRYQNEAELRRRAVAAYRAYRKARFHSIWRIEGLFRALRDGVLWALGRRYDPTANVPPPPICFVGLWDTVAAYGLPIEEMTHGVSRWIWPLELPNRTLGPTVERACHALALDDERTTFHPVLWSERDESRLRPDEDGRCWTKDERLSQVWFAGSHANVGGGYPDDSLAQVSLTWIMKEAVRRGLRFKEAPDADPDSVRAAFSSSDKDGRLYDSRHGLAGYYRYGPRKLYDLCHRRAAWGQDDEVTVDLPKIHETAIDRAVNGAHAYAPIGLPERYAVVMRGGEILQGKRNPFETPEQARHRAGIQEHVWDLVWWRRVVYFATLGASGYLALFPLLYQIERGDEYATRLRLVSEGVRLLGAFLPGFAGWWIAAFAASPGRFLAGTIVLAAFMIAGVKLGNTINGTMHGIWRTILLAKSVPHGAAPGGAVYALRTNRIYQGLHALLKRHLIPFASAVLLVYLGAALAGHLAFNAADAAGSFCRESEPATLKTLDAAAPPITVQGFDPSSMCWSTGVRLDEGRRYRITISRPEGWHDRTIPVDLSGFEITDLEHLGSRVRLFTALPLRRMLTRPWFRPIARIGATGSDEYPLDPDVRLTPATRQATGREADVVVADITARHTDELFLYVNDAVIGLPGLTDVFYRNNGGRAQVEITRLGRR